MKQLILSAVLAVSTAYTAAANTADSQGGVNGGYSENTSSATKGGVNGG